jgi:hypothetical protein
MSVTVELVSNSYRRHNPLAQTISTMTGIAVHRPTSRCRGMEFPRLSGHYDKPT